ncbi:hypothetical protein AAG570_011071 [Ranatra chinensis]|uniref:Uncharacterized protein n=1 Tax=Ranatra chinensis TaxID=642074 RepID=A0ABD0YJU2_9HEMI
MYKTVRQGESCLQYRIVGQEEYRRTVKRSRSGRIACLLTGALVVACLTVAGAVLMPILLTTNIVALPAGLHTFALRPQPAQLQQQQQYIAIVPVREAKFRIVGQQEALNGTLQPALLTAQWAGLALWKVSQLFLNSCKIT